MSEIKTLPFDKEKFGQIKSQHFGMNWPVVYVLEDGKEMYIGETVNVYGRSNQHYENPERSKLKNIHIITDEEYNKSATLDIESSLIQYIAAEGIYKMQNGNQGLLNHNYFDRQKYQAKFEVIWQKLKEKGLVKNDLVQVRNTDLFKYSPYKALTEDQLVIVDKLINKIKSEKSSTSIINGGPGTGKTIVATYLIKNLKDLEATKHLEVALVIAMTSLRNSIKQVFRNIKGLNASMVIGPNEVTRKKYDILIVDEAHRLKRRKNITNYQSFDQTNRIFNLDNNGTELDWVMRSSAHQILFYDKNQTVRPSDIRADYFEGLNAQKFKLKTQLRVKGGDAYIDLIDGLFELRELSENKISDYGFMIYESIHEMVSDIKNKNSMFGLSRIISGYAWPWVSRDNPEKHDIEIDGLKLKWNSVNQGWINSKNSINEVGCIHTVQGYDLNYAGVIIGPEISYDKINKKIIVYRDKYKDINGARGIDDPSELERYIINIYKTLLTRAICGTYLYIVDKNLREYFESRLGNAFLKKKIHSNNTNKIKSPYLSNYEMVNLPLFDSVGCGELMHADSTVQEIIPVRKDYVSAGSKYFVLRTSGDSMNKAGINDGDLVLCRKDYHPDEGNKVVALIGDDATIKEYRREGAYIHLRPLSTNPNHKILKFGPDDEIKVQGVVIRVLDRNDN